MVTIVVTRVMKAAASAAAALLPRASPLTFLLDPVMPATVEAAASMAVLLWDRAAALAFRASVETEQAAMEETASSSNFLQVEKASLQAFRPWAMADTSVILQSLTASLAMVISGADQQAQASVAAASLLMVIHSVARVLNKSVALTQASTKVMLGMGKLVVQEAFTRTSQSNRVLVRLVSCKAPSEVAEPEQVRADLLPPPRSTSLRAMGPNTDCLPDFLPAISDCLSILFFCFSKLVTTSFHLLMAVTALSRHTPSMVLVDFLVPLLFFLFLFLFFLFFLFFLLFLFFLFFLLFLPFLFFLVLFFLFFLFFSSFFAFLFFLCFLFLFLRAFLFFFPASASANLATLEDASSSERLLSSLFSAEARTAMATTRPKTIRQSLLSMFLLRGPKKISH